MKELLFGMTLGALAGAMAFKKLEDKKLPQKVLAAAQKLDEKA